MYIDVRSKFVINYGDIEHIYADKLRKRDIDIKDDSKSLTKILKCNIRSNSENDIDISKKRKNLW